MRFARILYLGMVFAVLAPAPADAAVDALQVDHTTQPLGIDDPQPSLSWKLRASGNGVHQTAYRVLVASSPSRLQPGQQDVWDSGKVASADSVDVPYAGPALESSRPVLLGRAGVGRRRPRLGWSEPSWFETGLLPATGATPAGSRPTPPISARGRTSRSTPTSR